MESVEGRRLHGLAAEARERDELAKSLGLVFEALEAYLKDKDYVGASEVLADGSITLRNRAELTGESGYMIVAKHFAMSSVEMAEKSGEKEALAVPYFNLAKVQEAMEEFPEAVLSFQKALENLEQNPPYSHKNRPAIVADYKIHLFTCQYRGGDKSSLDKALGALEELEAVESSDERTSYGDEREFEGTYNKLVWLSGAHMDIARMLKDDDLSQAREHLDKAKEIIDSDERLKIRARQWEKLAKELKSD